MILHEKKGFIIPLVIIIGLLIVGGGVYMYKTKKPPAISNTEISTSQPSESVSWYVAPRPYYQGYAPYDSGDVFVDFTDARNVSRRYALETSIACSENIVKSSIEGESFEDNKRILGTLQCDSSQSQTSSFFTAYLRDGYFVVERKGWEGWKEGQMTSSTKVLLEVPIEGQRMESYSTATTSLSVTYPIGGETFSRTEPFTVRWKSTLAGRVEVVLGNNNVSSCLLGTAPASDGFFVSHVRLERRCSSTPVGVGLQVHLIYKGPLAKATDSMVVTANSPYFFLQGGTVFDTNRYAVPIITYTEGEGVGNFEMKAGQEITLWGDFECDSPVFIGGEPVKVLGSMGCSQTQNISAPEWLVPGRTYDLYVDSFHGRSNIVQVKAL
jgi:hypothetical protein